MIDADSGILVDPRDDVGAYADALQRLLADPQLRRAMGEHARAVARERYTLEVMAAAHADLYTRLAAERHVAATGEAAPSPRPQPVRFQTRVPASRPLVSVIVPCYNHGTYLLDCVASLRAQTYPTMETIVELQDGLELKVAGNARDVQREVGDRVSLRVDPAMSVILAK